jgi:hypothetical protein
VAGAQPEGNAGPSSPELNLPTTDTSHATSWQREHLYKRQSARQISKYMASLNSTHEWRVLQGVGSRVAGKLARFRPATGAATAKAGSPQTRNRDARSKSHHCKHDNNLAFLETELREVLMWQPDPTRSMLPDVVEKLRRNLAELCTMLENAVNVTIVPTEDTEDNRQLEQRSPQSYPKLIALCEFLDESGGGEETASVLHYDLVYGPNERLFTVATGLEAKTALDKAWSCNELLVRLHDDGDNQFKLNPTSARKSANDAAASRPATWTRACQVLEALFRQFSGCSPDHAVLLRLAQGVDGSYERLPVELFLQCHSHSGGWKEAQCLKYDWYVLWGRIVCTNRGVDF